MYFALQKIDVNSVISGRLPIHFAADYGHTAVLEYLISKGAKVNVSHLTNISNSKLYLL